MTADRNDRAIGCLVIFVGVIMCLAAAVAATSPEMGPYAFPLYLGMGIANFLLGLGVWRAVPWVLLTVAILYGLEVVSFPLRGDWSNPGRSLPGVMVGVILGLVISINCLMRFLELTKQNRSPR